MYITLVDHKGERMLVQIPDSYQRFLSELISSQGYISYEKCKGNGICRSCRIKVLKGLEKLPLPDQSEQLLLQDHNNFCPASRLACRIAIDEKLNGLIVQLL